MEEDYIMRQIKLVSESIGILLKKKSSQPSIAEVQREDGSKTSRVDTIIEYIAEDRIPEAFILVNELKYYLSNYDFQNVASWFIDLLKTYQKDHPEALATADIERYQVLLSQLL